MPEKGAQDKSEKPTPRRRQKSREEGKVAKSQELNSVAVLFAGLGSLYFLGGSMYAKITDLMRFSWGELDTMHFDLGQMQQMSITVLEQFLLIVMPVWMTVFLAAALMNIAQVGFLLALKRIKPDLKKINPLEGVKKFFSLRILVEAFKNVGKLVVVAATAWLTLRQEWDNLPLLGQMETGQIVIYIVDVCFRIFWRGVLAMAVLAVLDWSYQKWEYEKGLKMSKQEIKDEFKQTEGDPMVKSRIRSIQREQARNRMMASVPEADVVITNPTHLAVALSYKMDEMDAPEVVAKGAGKIAAKIKQTAREAGVPVIEDKPLAQVLYRTVEVGEAIPADLYETVATILAHVYRQNNRHREILNR